MTQADVTPDEIVAFWFPEGPDPEPEEHMNLWIWRMRGGAHDEVVAEYPDLTRRVAAGEFDHWAKTPKGRLALIIVLDQFSRSVWAGSPKAYAQDMKALELCIEGFDNGHFDALENVWQKTAYRIPLEHCECPDHLANLDRAVANAEQLVEEAPEQLRESYRRAVQQPVRHRAVIARFGRHAHRNPILGRPSTPEELEYIETGDFPHQSDIRRLAEQGS
ncbi:MAG: DUF924 domain-containing protein [Hyphomicrobiales bacterium]|nr:DUF924 domain-containing protein [Hyphomicrobiales bacterium]